MGGSIVKYHWRPSKDNYADYWTKHHPALHQAMRKIILNNPKALKIMTELSTREQ
jgi:hypothetical protein